MPAPDSRAETPASPAEKPREATLREVAAAVFWSFFGVRKGQAMRRDAVSIKPRQVIIVGVALAAVFVVTLLLLVQMIIRSVAV